MSTAVQNMEFDSIENKFFDLVIQPPVQPDLSSKIAVANAPKNAGKLERKPRLPYNFERNRFLLGNKKAEKKEATKSSSLVKVDTPKKRSPLQVVLTPNPSATILQCRILHEIKNVEQSAALLKKLVKQNQTDSTSAEDNSSTEAHIHVPHVIELGLFGVFELIRETASKHNGLCCKALEALLNMLQGQDLEGMKNEPFDVLENLFQVLLDLSRTPEENISLASEEHADSSLKTTLPGVEPVDDDTIILRNIPSLACSCLLGLVFVWGNTEKLLSVIASFIADCSNQKGPLYIKIPATFIELQRTVLAAMLEEDHIPTPLEVGINQSSLFQSWTVQFPHDEEIDLLSIQCDGSYLYALFSNSLIVKVGTGYNLTVQGHVYKACVISDFEGCSSSRDNVPKYLLYFDDLLYFLTSNGSFCVLHRNDLSSSFEYIVQSDDKTWFCHDCPRSIGYLPKEEAFVFKSYLADEKSFVQSSSLKVRPSKRHLIVLGKQLPFNPIKECAPEKDHYEISQLLLGADFTLSRTDKGQVYFAGKSEALGLKGKNKKVFSPEVLPLPTVNKISHISVASDGGHAILVSENGDVYFTGTAHRGEDGEASKSRRQPPQKAKLMKCVEGKKVISGYCNAGTSALITAEGKLYLFGKDSTQADSKTGFVSALNGVHVSQVALGKAHVVVASDDGRIWTAGVNNRGQCGRQEGVMSITQRIAEVELEKDVSMPEDKSMEDLPIPRVLPSRDAPIAPICSPDKHKWKKEVCMICAVCCECTGYGSSCVNSSVDGRYPGMPCGCGAGWSGCSECGCCRTCAGMIDVNSDGKKKDEFRFGSPDPEYQPLGGDPPSPLLNKLALLFHPKNAKKASNPLSRDNKISSKTAPSKSDILKEANKMALLPLVQILLPKELSSPRKPVQIACGDHHTVALAENGMVCVFGKNNHGQLGLGDTTNRNLPKLLDLPFKVVQISCGSHHTLFLTDAGLVYGCGSNSHGQLGDVKNLDSKDVLTPRLILLFQQNSQQSVSRVSWISASQTSSFIKYEEVLLSVDQLQKAKVFGDHSFIGISYKPNNEYNPSQLLLIDQHTSQCQHFTKDCLNISESSQVCIDKAHNILYSFNSSDWSVESYMLCGYKKQTNDESHPFLPQHAIPLLNNSLTTRTQAGLNLLSCLNMLVTRCPRGLNVTTKSAKENTENGSVSSKPTGKSVEHTADEYNIVCRFKSHGGGWGYSVHSTEAIRFTVDTDIMLGGVGVFGGRGEYSVSVTVYEEVGESESQGDGEILVETDRVPYECGFREKFHVLFGEPVAITSGQWYTVTCKISGPSSDCGSHGEQHVLASDNVKFTFRRSKRSNNGTDVSAGQIPELLYSLPSQTPVNEVEVLVKPKNAIPVQSISKDFYMSFSEGVFESLPYVLEWARTSLFVDVSKKSSRYDDANVEIVPVREKIVSDAISNLSFVISVCLRLLRVAILKTMPTNGVGQGLQGYITQCTGLVEAILTDGEVDASLNDALLMPSHDRDLVVSSAISMVTECHAIMVDCVEAFYPTPPQKWSYLHQALENYTSAPASKKSRMGRLLVAVLDSLCQSSVDLVQCLPLFPRTFSNLDSVASPSLDQGVCDSPLLPDRVGFYEVAYSLVEIACSPAHVAVKIENELIANNALSFNGDHTVFTRLLLFPDKSLITSACKLLSSLTNDLSYRASDTTTLMAAPKQEKVLFTVMRFESTDNSKPWNSGNGSPDGICFSVDTDDVLIHGFGAYGGGKDDHRYELKFLMQSSEGSRQSKTSWDTLEIVKGSYSTKDCGSDHIYNIKFNKPFPIKKRQIYGVRFHNHGDRTYCGERGKSSVKGPDGATFHFAHSDQSTNGTSVSRGQIPTIIYQRSSPEEELPASPSDKWVGTATTPATAGLAYQRHALNILALVTESAVEIFSCVTSDDLLKVNDDGNFKQETVNSVEEAENDEENLVENDAKSSATLNEDLIDNLKIRQKEKARNVLSTELITTLLPEIFFHIGVLVSENPHCAVEVMELIRNILLPLINIQQLSYPASKEDSKIYSLVVESSHPYKPATVDHYKASFPSSVNWMLVEFSSKSQTGQTEDFLQLYLTKLQKKKGDHSWKKLNYPVLSKMCQDKNWPQDAVLLPGSNLEFVLETASDYTNNRDQKPHLFYGFRCVVTGYESIPLSQDHDGSYLVNELINTAGLACTMLMKVHEQLWTEEENYHTPSPESNQDKVEHLKAIESSAAVTLERHGSLFLPGLHLDFFPGSSQALNGNLPISEGSKEKMFLHDFVSAAPDSTGGRLARWLQPDAYVDPKQCLLHLNTKSLIHTLPTAITIVTRDQYGNPAFVPTLKVDLSAKPQPSSHVNLANDHCFAADNFSSTEPSPVFETRYEPTRHRESRYHTVTMMRAYKNYSFEELRIAYPLKRTLKTENILVAHVSKGTYRATWIPSIAATYTLQVTFDQQLRGPRQLVTVADAPLGCTEHHVKPVDLECRLLRFATKNSRGLRVRSNPTLQSSQVGLLVYDDVIEYCGQIQNNDGNWVNLTKTSIEKYCKEGTLDAWCVSFHKHNNRTFLLPVENKVKKIVKFNKKPDPKAGMQSTVEMKKLMKISKKVSTASAPTAPRESFSPDVPTPSGFSKASGVKSKTFPDAFSSPTLDGELQWKERVPGEYKLVNCGKSGHNIRYNPSLKATPIGKLVLGNVFMAMSVKRNKSGTWLLLHKSSLSQFCEEIPDDRHAWTLAVSRDGTQHLLLKDIVALNEIRDLTAQTKKAIVHDSEIPKTNMNHQTTSDKERPSSSQDLDFEIPSNPFEALSFREAKSDVASHSAMRNRNANKKPRDNVSEKRQPRWESRVKQHHRSSSESAAARENKKKSDSTPEAGRVGRGKGYVHTPKTTSRSHSNPGAKRRTSSHSSAPKPMPRKTLVELQTARQPGLYPGVSAKAPSGKSIRGGQKKVSNLSTSVNVASNDEIPFIDDVTDAEGNILSPVNPDGGKIESDGNNTNPRTGEKEKVKERGEENEDVSVPDQSEAPKLRKEKLLVKTKSVKYSYKDTQSSKSKKSADSYKAISPLVAECSRAVFAAFLWHEGIVHDAMACASFLKFNRTERSQIMKHANPVGPSAKDIPQRRHSSESSDDEMLKAEVDSSRPPDTLVHLAMFWDRLSETVTKIAVKNQSLPLPTPVNQNLNCNGEKAPLPSKGAKRYNNADAVANGFKDVEHYMKVPPLKRKAIQRNYHANMPFVQARRNFPQPMLPYFQPLQGNAEAGDHFKDTACDLCDKVHPYPVTYHMKQAHPGCGRFAGGLGYNSSGHYCGGWAGDCGDGGMGGSTWYLLCGSCREIYLAKKGTEAPAKKAPSMKSNGTWINRLHHMMTLPTNAHQVMKDNAMFLLNLVSSSNSSPPLYEQKRSSGSSKLGILHDDTEMDEQKVWDQNDLLPRSTYCHCPFPSIPCAYLAKHGKENGINNNIRPQQVPNNRSGQEYRNRSLSNQATPSGGQFKHIFTQRLSITPDSTPQKTDSVLFQRSNRLIRSVSTGSQPQRRRACSGGDVSPIGGNTGSFLLHNPSASMKRMMHGRSGNSNNIARDAVHGSPVLPFVTQRHDLKSLHTTLQMTLRRAAIRVYVLQALTWLLRTVVSESSIHDILWYFVSALAGSTSTIKRNNEIQKNSESDSADDEIGETKPLYEHPVKDMLNAGIHSMMPLVEAFHSFLQTVSDIMMDLPPNSPVQLMAIRCWSLRVLPSDHQFLHNSQVFSHISQILSKVDAKASRTPQHKLVKVKLNQQSQQYVPVSDAYRDLGKVSFLRDLTSKVQIKTSSHASIVNSLTDGSTETFWESGDEDKNRAKHIIVDLDGVGDTLKKLLVHIDNTRDPQKKVISVTFLVENDDGWAKRDSRDLTSQYAGWCMFDLPFTANKLKIELRGPDNGLRVRQVKVLGDAREGVKYIEQLPSHVLRSQTCEAELLKVFKLLTAEVFGQLLSEQHLSSKTDDSSLSPSSQEEREKSENAHDVGKSSNSVPVSPRDVDPNLREHMVGILFSRSKLTSLQKKVFEHTVQALHTEAARIKEVWEAGLNASLPQAAQAKVEESDTYCFELLSMILALSGSNVGYHYVAQQSGLIKDFVSLLHTGTPRVQRQITLLFRRILSEITPDQLAAVLSAKIPSQDKLSGSSVSETLSTSSSAPVPEFSFSVLDPFFACIAKALSVQVKGFFEPVPSKNKDSEAKPKKACSMKMQESFPGRPASDSPTWWMHGFMKDRSTVEAIIKLLADMTANEISPAWGAVTKCSVAESILALTRLSEDNRNPGHCLKNVVTWQALASLCVLDRDHVEKLSSARSSQSKTKLTCENHDDGATPAIVQCSECGNLCSECDRYLHLNKRTSSHQRQVFKEEEEAIQVNLHEGCGRIKLFWFMALADANTLKAIVEFKSRTPGQRQRTTTTGVCRFCGNSSDNGQLAVSNVCSDVACQQYATMACTRTHTCGHLCGGVKDEVECLQCLHSSCNPTLNQDADDMCMICFTDALCAAPAIQLECGHTFHYHCCETQLKKQWAGPRITFGFMLCSICKTNVKHISLEALLKPLRDLIKEVERKALQRLEYEGLNENPSITAVGGRFYKDPTGFALNKYAYYMCCKCNKAYYGGEVRCDAEAGGEDLFDPQELICGACSNVSCAQICPKHGTDFLEYKCRYCCSVAVYFCFGTTHFCQPCHDDFQRITSLPKNDLPHCPAGHKARQLEGKECPLHVQHPATGEEFALGCGVCRNAHTF